MTDPPTTADAAARVLLVDPYMSRSDPMERKFIELYPSLGLLTLGAYLRDNGTPVSMVDLTFAREDVDASTEGVPPALLPKALEEQLGLKLAPSKEPVKTLIVDRADMVPIEN